MNYKKRQYVKQYANYLIKSALAELQASTPKLKKGMKVVVLWPESLEDTKGLEFAKATIRHVSSQNVFLDYDDDLAFRLSTSAAQKFIVAESIPKKIGRNYHVKDVHKIVKEWWNKPEGAEEAGASEGVYKHGPRKKKAMPEISKPTSADDLINSITPEEIKEEMPSYKKGSLQDQIAELLTHYDIKKIEDLLHQGYKEEKKAEETAIRKRGTRSDVGKKRGPRYMKNLKEMNSM